jgi:hypothetical protein
MNTRGSLTSDSARKRVYTEKLLQILILGQPKPLTQLSRPEMRQLKQRVALTFQLHVKKTLKEPKRLWEGDTGAISNMTNFHPETETLFGQLDQVCAPFVICRMYSQLYFVC